MIKRSIALLLATSLALTPIAAYAATPEQLAAARKKFDHAVELEKASDFKGALAVLREVAAVKATAEVRFHLGICLERLGRLVEARAEYVASKSDAELKEGSDAAVLTQKANDRITDLDARIPKIAITVPEDVVHAKVSVDNAPPVSLLVTPIISVDPGTHKLVITAPGRRAFSRTVLVKERDPIFNMSAELPPEEIEETPAPAPVAKPALPPRHRDETPKSSPYPYVFGGLGLVSLGVAGIMYALRDSTIHDMDERCPTREGCSRSISDIESRGRTYTTTGNILLGVGAAALATGVIIYLAEPKKKKTSVTVGGGPATLGVTFTSSF